MKRKMFMTLVLALFLCMTVAAERYAKVVNVRTQLNIRATADARSDIMGKIQPGERVQILSADSASEWTQIQYGSVTGYVKSTYLQEVAAPVKKESGSSSWGTWLWILIIAAVVYGVYRWKKGSSSSVASNDGYAKKLVEDVFRCNTCKFYDGEKQGSGTCHRESPKPIDGNTMACVYHRK